MIAIAIGITEGGGIVRIYEGNDFAVAQNEAMQKGNAGEIIRAEVYKNPIPAWRQDFTHIKKAKEAEAAKAKPKQKQA
jgi:hypothetical protein